MAGDGQYCQTLHDCKGQTLFAEQHASCVTHGNMNSCCVVGRARTSRAEAVPVAGAAVGQGSAV